VKLFCFHTNEDNKKSPFLKGLFYYTKYKNCYLLFGFPLGTFLSDLGPTFDIAHLNPI
jgi:hypothetical protein